MERILVVVAHPDDEILGCGGTIAKLAALGHRVRIAILGEGVTSRYKDRNDAPGSLLDDLHRQSSEVASLLGAEHLYSFSMPDNRFDTVPLLDIVKTVEEVFSDFRPDTVFTHYGADLNIDHCLSFKAVMTASRPVEGNPVKEVLVFETPSSTDWAFQRSGESFAPNMFINIRDTFSKKISAMAVYSSEGRQFPHPRSPEALEAAARRWGSVSGFHAAEAFQLISKFIP